MIVDMHANLLPDDQEAIEQMRHLGNVVADPARCTLSGTLERLDSYGIDQAVVWRIGRSASECRRNNDFVAAAAGRHPDRLIPFATVWPHDPDGAIREAARAVGEMGMRGIKLHPVLMEERTGDPGFLTVVECARELDVPFVTHVNLTVLGQLTPGGPYAAADRPRPEDRSPFAEPEGLSALLDAWDSPRVQAAHMGGLWLERVRSSNITFQTTGASRQVLQWAVDNVGADRIVFGADFPFYFVDDELLKVTSLEASQAEKEAILSGNALTRVLADPR